MSSVKYGDKSLDEIKKIVEAFKESYTKHFGIEPEPHSITQKLRALKAKKEEEHFHQIFGGMTAKNLRECCEVLEDQLKKSLSSENKKNKSSKG